MDLRKRFEHPNVQLRIQDRETVTQTRVAAGAKPAPSAMAAAVSGANCKNGTMVYRPRLLHRVA